MSYFVLPNCLVCCFIIEMLTLADLSPRFGKRVLTFLLFIARNFVTSVRRGFLFLLVLCYCIVVLPGLSV